MCERIAPRPSTELLPILSPYIEAARRVSTKRQRRSASPASNAVRNRLIRLWARDNSYQVSVRGQIAGDIIRAFEEANPGQ